jgi:HlyD family secretion protein
MRKDGSSLRVSPHTPLLYALFLAACPSQPTSLQLSGTVEIRELRLASLAAGRVARLLKDEGDSVRRGDTIALLEQPGLSALIGQRRAQAQAAERRTAEVAAALADSARAANDLARASRLREQGIMAPQQYDNLVSAATAAAARLQAIRSAASDARAAAQGLAATEAIRDELVLIAPADGIILTRYLEPGEAAAVGTPIVSLGVVSQPWVRAYVGERFIARLRPGQTVAIRADGVGAPIAGRVIEIASRAEFTPRAALTERERADLVFGIKVAFDDPAGRLKAGLPVTLEIPLTP